MARRDRRWIYAGLVGLVGLGVARALASARVHPGDRILLLGDSLAVGLGPHLGALARDLGATLKVVAKEGTTVRYWADSETLVQAIEAFQPTLILVSLGTNDEYFKSPSLQAESGFVDRLLERLTTWPRRIDYGLGPENGIVWIGPPTLPKPTNGMVGLIRQRVSANAEAKYFDSEKLTIPRGPDRIHPVARGYASWAASIWQWLS